MLEATVGASRYSCLSIAQYHALGSPFLDADLLPEAQPCRQDLLVSQRGFILQVHDARGTVDLPRGDGNAHLPFDLSLARRDRVAVRVMSGMSKRCIQFIELRIGKIMLPAVGFGMDLSQRHARFVCQVAFPQPVRPNHVQCPAFTFRAEMDLRPARLDQSLCLHAFDQAGHL